MMICCRTSVLSAMILLLAGGAAWAQAAEPVRVYTNADVEALEPLPVSGEPCEPDQPCDLGGWDFVIDFIERERARIEADRTFELEHRRLDVEAERGRGYAVPYLGYPYNPDYGWRHRYPWLPRVTDPAPGHPEPSRIHVPHWRFLRQPPVREHVPGLGNTYRSPAAPPGRSAPTGR